MNILVLHGPNLNLIGSISANIGQRITLDKINTGLRRHVRNSKINLKNGFKNQNEVKLKKGFQHEINKSNIIYL